MSWGLNSVSTLLHPELKESGCADHNPELGLVQGHGEGLATGLCRTLASSPAFSSFPVCLAWLQGLLRVDGPLARSRSWLSG